MYGYAQRIHNAPDLITYIQDEQFETLIIRNLRTSQEIRTSISDCEQLCCMPCYMDTMYVAKGTITLEYDHEFEHPKRKVINIKSILN